MYKLLIADDEYEIRKGLQNCFLWNEIGFNVVGTVKDGNEILHFIEYNHVDVVLSDIMMPNMDGIELAHTFFERRSEIMLVFISGYKMFDYAQKAIVYGVKDYILKPTTNENLTNVFTRIKLELDIKTNRHLIMDHTRFFEKTGNQIIDAIHKYTYENYKTVNLSDIAHIINQNVQHVGKYYKNKTGKNFSDYLLQIKMKKAAELLKDFHNMIYEVSEAVGYTNPKNFARSFKNYYGMSPSEFQKLK